MEKSLSNQQNTPEQPPGAGPSRVSALGSRIYLQFIYPVKTAVEAIINARKAKRTVTRGLELIKGKLYKRATVEFQIAVELSEEVALRLLEFEFQEVELSGEPEAVLSIGLVMLAYKPQDYALANNLGNAARRGGDFKQANDLYRKSLRINKEYQKAFYNLAASMGKVDKYDYDIKQTIDKYIKSDDFILPEYQNNPDIINIITKNLRERKRTEKTKRLQKLRKEKQQKATENDKYEVKRITNMIERMEKVSIEPKYKEICAALTNIVKKSEAKQSSPEEQTAYQGSIFNLALYSFIEKDPNNAQEWFEYLKIKNTSYEHLDMMLALVTHLKIDEKEAIKKMFDLISKDQYNRYLNINLGLLYKKAQNRLVAAKYLAIGASLLERSEGLYRVTDMMNVAARKYEEGKSNKALQLYRIVATETNNAEAWLKIAQIYKDTEKWSEAVKAYQALLEVNPESEEAAENLMQLHDMYCERAEEVFQNRKFSQAAAFYERALLTNRLPKTIERTAAIYKQLNKTDRVEALMDELNQIRDKEHEEQQEQLRQEYILKGNTFLQRKAFEKAIANLEKAFRMKVDKDIFMSLAYIYKGMKRDQDLSSLQYRWAKMNRLEDEMKRKQKDKEREAAMVDDEDEVDS